MGKTKLETQFADIKKFSSDVWVADYTEQAHEKGKNMISAERKKLKTGVYIQGKSFTDINAFCLHNRKGKEVMIVNFEHNKSFFPSGNRDCECLVRPMHVRRGWLLLCELKYCLEKNKATNADSAYKQLLNTWQLIEQAKLYDKRRVKVFFNISMPNIKSQLPFTAFLINQDEYLTWCHKNKVHLLGINDILMLNEGILQALPPQI